MTMGASKLDASARARAQDHSGSPGSIFFFGLRDLDRCGGRVGGVKLGLAGRLSLWAGGGGGPILQYIQILFII
jgi:hypothetical protein